MSSELGTEGIAPQSDLLIATPPARRQATPTSRSAATGHVWRGALIALIVLGHNRLFASLFPELYRLVYNFHVEAFLIIPFLRVSVSRRKPDLLYPLATYYRPFAVFVTLYALLFALSHGPGAAASAGEALDRYLRALTLANSAALNDATGFKMFWFLPVFILLSTLRPLVERLGATGFAVALAVAVTLHLGTGYLDVGTVALLPWGLPILAYMLLPCLLAAGIARSGIARRLPIAVPVSIFAAMTLLCFLCGFWINLSDFNIYRADTLPALIVTDLDMIAAALIFARIDAHVRSRLLDALGKHSLAIYLIHGIIGYALVSATRHGHAWSVKLAMLLVIYPVTLALSYAVARALAATPAGKWLFGR